MDPFALAPGSSEGKKRWVICRFRLVLGARGLDRESNGFVLRRWVDGQVERHPASIGREVHPDAVFEGRAAATVVEKLGIGAPASLVERPRGEQSLGRDAV